jgi:cytochrome c553
MMRDFLVLPVLVGSFVALGSAVAGTDPIGLQIARTGNGHGASACITCHGKQLEGDAALNTPALAGLPAEFILSRLAHYSSPQGHNAMMRQVATALSSEERHAVATYLAGLTPISGPPH